MPFDELAPGAHSPVLNTKVYNIDGWHIQEYEIDAFSKLVPRHTVLKRPRTADPGDRALALLGQLRHYTWDSL